MTNQQFLQKFFHLLKVFVSQQIIEKKYGLLGYLDRDSSVYWNTCLLSRVINETELQEIELQYIQLKRQSTVSFENREEFAAFKKFLNEHGYAKSFEDTWLFFAGEEIDTSGFGDVRKVMTEQELETFLETFNQSYQADDPQNPYGEQSNYLDVIRRSWLVHHKDDNVECFIVYDNEIPVAVSTLNNFGDLGYISNVGSLRSVRGKRFGKLATLYAVWVAQQKKKQIICLITEEGTYPHEFYQRIGFEKKFSAVGYTKKS